MTRILTCSLLLIGALLLGGGARLSALGGSPYYLLSGIALVGSAVLLWRRRGEGVLLYGAIFLATLSWAMWEVGFDVYKLLPRIALLSLLGMGLLLRAVRRQLIWPPAVPSPRLVVATLAGAVIVGSVLRVALPLTNPVDPLYRAGTIPFRAHGTLREAGTSSVVAPRAATHEAEHDWRHYGNDAGGGPASVHWSKSPLTMSASCGWLGNIRSRRMLRCMPRR